MGQVWSSADFDGIREKMFEGGCGSPLAVTAQNLGRDGIPFTDDDVLVPMNASPATVSLDSTQDDNCADRKDTVRGFFGMHTGGVFFVYGDGSVHFLEEEISPRVYISLSTINGGELVDP